ncbi:MAG: response regulator, partial [Candidatus Komeilibacteria bacterium]|nr:response regulator [Candidatus Komeilibacteria bacterium]
VPILNQNLVVLIVEDEVQVAQTLSDALLATGLVIKPLLAENGKIALKMIETVTPDLLITDGHMSEMTGPELVVELQGKNFTGQIIAVTGDGTSENGFNELGVNLLLKPYRLRQLVELINQLCPAPSEQITQ